MAIAQFSENKSFSEKSEKSEADLYARVTDYLREEYNGVDTLEKKDAKER